MRYTLRKCPLEAGNGKACYGVAQAERAGAEILIEPRRHGEHRERQKPTLGRRTSVGAATSPRFSAGCVPRTLFRLPPRVRDTHPMAAVGPTSVGRLRPSTSD